MALPLSRKSPDAVIAEILKMLRRFIVLLLCFFENTLHTKQGAIAGS
jgi:hypothetical protein